MRLAWQKASCLAASGLLFGAGACLNDAGKRALRLAGEGLITGASQRAGDLLIDEFFLQDLTRDVRLENDLQDAEQFADMAE